MLKAGKHQEALELFGKLLKEGLKRPELMPDRLVIISLSEEEQGNVLTKGRLHILRVLHRKQPKSVGALAELLGRRVDAVSRDLRSLSNYGFLEMVQEGKQKKPVVTKDAVVIPLGA